MFSCVDIWNLQEIGQHLQCGNGQLVIWYYDINCASLWLADRCCTVANNLIHYSHTITLALPSI